MSICWYCYWGWSNQVAEIYKKTLVDLDGYDSPLISGPAHIVWGDENFDKDSIEWCLENFDKYRGDYSDKDLIIVKRSLEELLVIPEKVRDPEPEDYDGEHPENYPPPENMEMVII